LSLPANVQLGACLYGARDFDGAVDQCWKTLTLAPQFAPAQILLALAYEQLGMYEEAAVEFKNAQRCVGFETIAATGLSHAFAVAEHLSKSEPELSQQSNRPVSTYERALLCAARGETRRAVHFLEESLQQKDFAMLWLAADARFDRLREDEGFQTLLSRIGGRAPTSAFLCP
jgi:tetratricopeptide (TPR) repeat protein